MKLLFSLMILSSVSSQAADTNYHKYGQCLAKLESRTRVADRQVGTYGVKESPHRTGSYVIIPASRKIETNGQMVEREGVYVLGEVGRDVFVPFPNAGEKGAKVEMYRPGVILGGSYPTGKAEYYLSIPARPSSEAMEKGGALMGGLEGELHLYFSTEKDKKGKLSGTAPRGPGADGSLCGGHGWNLCLYPSLHPARPALGANERR